jgi:hypothetical protein
MSKAHCQAKTKTGKPCRMAPLKGCNYCFNHDPATAAQRAQARKAGGQARHTGHAGDPSIIPTEINTIADARQILTYTLAELLNCDNGIQRNRALIAIFDSYLRSLEIGEIEARLEALEKKRA